MKKFLQLLLGAFVILLILLSALATWVWQTIPSAPDPDALPSRSSSPPAEAYREAVEQGQSIARILLAEDKLPGLSLAVAIEGELVWAEGFRWADMEAEIPVTPETLFRIGGISQSLSAAAAGLLVERGELDLDVAVQHYLPSFPEEKWPITMRQLMAHSAGIRPFRGEGGIFRGACADDAERLAIFAGDPQRYRPGSDVQYSAHGWTLVGALIAAAAEEPYPDFLRREIFEPLGMRSTVAEIAGRGEEGSARFYYPRMMLNPRYGLQEAPKVDFSCHVAAVGFLSTPTDLVRFGSAMMSAELLDSATVEELFDELRLDSGEATGQALGWSVRELPSVEGESPLRIIGQGLGEVIRSRPLSVETVGGQVAGSTASLLLLPARQLAIAVATNVSGSKNVPLLTERLAEIFDRALRER